MTQRIVFEVDKYYESGFERMENPTAREYQCKTCWAMIPEDSLVLHKEWHDNLRYILHALWNKVGKSPSQVPERLLEV